MRNKRNTRGEMGHTLWGEWERKLERHNFPESRARGKSSNKRWRHESQGGKEACASQEKTTLKEGRTTSVLHWNRGIFSVEDRHGFQGVRRHKLIQLGAVVKNINRGHIFFKNKAIQYNRTTEIVAWISRKKSGAFF